MAKYFTHYWQNDTWDDNSIFEGETLCHTAGNQFRDRGVMSGDIIYVVTVKKGILHVAGKMSVRIICDEDQAREILGDDVWEAQDQVVAREGSRQRYNNHVSSSDAKGLFFVSGEDEVPLKFKDQYRLDQQTLRGVRRLTKWSTQILDKYCGPMAPCNR